MSSDTVTKDIYHNKFFTMGAQCQLLLPGVSHEFADQVFNVIKKDVIRLENEISHFKEESEISHINRTAAIRPVPVSEEVFDILKLCRKYFEMTHGLFDITVRPLYELWNSNPNEPPPKSEIEALLKLGGMNSVTINETDHTISFGHKRIKIDFSGIGKGYTLEKIKKQLRRFSIKNAFVSFGESTILALGSHPEGDHWKVGMKNYLNPEKMLHTFRVRDGAVSTTGNFYVDHHGRQQNRLVLNPLTGSPVGNFTSVSVCSGSAILVEILSNVFLAASEEFIGNIVELVGRIDSIKVDYKPDGVEVKQFSNTKKLE